MIGVIITGHGNFALGMMSAIKLVFGNPRDLKIINFKEEDTTDVLEGNIKTAIHELKECDGLICFTDIAGGTPFQVAARLSIAEADMKVISGTNLPMLLGVLSERDEMTLEEAARYAVEAGKEEIQEFTYVISKKAEENQDNDGI